MRKENLCLQTENGECATCNSNDNVKTSRSRDEMMWKLFCLALSLLNTVQLCQAAPDILSEEPVAADTSGTSWQGDVGNDAADAAPNTSEVLAGPGQGPIEQRAGAPLPPSPQPVPRPYPTPAPSPPLSPPLQQQLLTAQWGQSAQTLSFLVSADSAPSTTRSQALASSMVGLAAGLSSTSRLPMGKGLSMVAMAHLGLALFMVSMAR
jgi:hypothetical protein